MRCSVIDVGQPTLNWPFISSAKTIDILAFLMEKSTTTQKGLLRLPFDMTLNHLRLIQITSLLDLGCSQGQFVRLAARSPRLRLLAALDIDSSALHQATINAIPEPLQSSIQYEREADLLVSIFEGDLVQPHPLFKSKEFDMISLIQVVEHLSSGQVEQASRTIWGYYRPRLVVLTTPNREFNAHFSNSSSFRHWDHKFEWTRPEFDRFCQKIDQEYGYSHEISGIGEHVSDPSKGACTQMAVFTLRSASPHSQSQLQEHPQNLALKGEYLIECWQSRLEANMKELFYRGLAFGKECTFTNLLDIIKQHRLGHCLAKQEVPLDEHYLKNFILRFKQCFECNEQQYWLLELEEDEDSCLVACQEDLDAVSFGFKEDL